MNESQVVFFLVTSILVILIPGQDMVLVMSRGLAQGAKAGIVTAAGVSVGLLGHTILAALGLGALLLSSELLFSILKFVGASYLTYLGIKLILTKASELELDNSNCKPQAKLFIEGALSNISNPQVTIFYFAFLPQ
ncbi:MAG: LysE family translocator, partial [Pseudomonadota bacterium]